MKTDESVWTGFASHNPRVETRGYSEFINDVIQVNPPIHWLSADGCVHIQINPQIHLWDQNVSKSPKTILMVFQNQGGF